MGILAIFIIIVVAFHLGKTWLNWQKMKQQELSFNFALAPYMQDWKENKEVFNGLNDRVIQLFGRQENIEELIWEGESRDLLASIHRSSSKAKASLDELGRSLKSIEWKFSPNGSSSASPSKNEKALVLTIESLKHGNHAKSLNALMEKVERKIAKLSALIEEFLTAQKETLTQLNELSQSHRELFSRIERLKTKKTGEMAFVTSSEWGTWLEKAVEQVKESKALAVRDPVSVYYTELAQHKMRLQKVESLLKEIEVIKKTFDEWEKAGFAGKKLAPSWQSLLEPSVKSAEEEMLKDLAADSIKFDGYLVTFREQLEKFKALQSLGSEMRIRLLKHAKISCFRREAKAMISELDAALDSLAKGEIGLIEDVFVSLEQKMQPMDALAELEQSLIQDPRDTVAKLEKQSDRHSELLANLSHGLEAGKKIPALKASLVEVKRKLQDGKRVQRELDRMLQNLKRTTGGKNWARMAQDLAALREKLSGFHTSAMPMVESLSKTT